MHVKFLHAIHMLEKEREENFFLRVLLYGLKYKVQSHTCIRAYSKKAVKAHVCTRGQVVDTRGGPMFSFLRMYWMYVRIYLAYTTRELKFAMVMVMMTVWGGGVEKRNRTREMQWVRRELGWGAISDSDAPSAQAVLVDADAVTGAQRDPTQRANAYYSAGTETAAKSKEFSTSTLYLIFNFFLSSLYLGSENFYVP